MVPVPVAQFLPDDHQIDIGLEPGASGHRQHPELPRLHGAHAHDAGASASRPTGCRQSGPFPGPMSSWWASGNSGRGPRRPACARQPASGASQPGYDDGPHRATRGSQAMGSHARTYPARATVGRPRCVVASRATIMGLAAFLTLALSGCGASSTPSPTPSATPTATGSATASATATATSSATAIPVPTATPHPTLPPTLRFVATGSMHTARDGATATLLKNC